jgi:copper(I)-binding protein
MNLTTTAKSLCALATFTLVALALAGCAPAMPSAAEEPAAISPTASDVWIKAVPQVMGDMGMTALFGVIENSSDEDIMIVGGTADTSLTLTPLQTHETATNDAGEMVMQEVKGGIVIPAHGSVTLKPGGYHVMLLDLLKPIAVGADVVATINFSNGTSLEITAVARDIANAQESYDPNADTGATPAPSSTMKME